MISVSTPPVWLLAVIATIFSGIILTLLISIKKKIIKISLVIVALTIFVVSTYGMYRQTQTEQQKKYENIIRLAKQQIELAKQQIERLTILVERNKILIDTRVKVGGNPNFISGDFVAGGKPPIEVVYPRGPTTNRAYWIDASPYTLSIDEITLENVDEGITMDSKNFYCVLSTATPKKNLTPGHYIANLTVFTLSFNGTDEYGEFKWNKVGKSKKYQTKFIVQKQFDIKEFFVSRPVLYGKKDYLGIVRLASINVSYVLTGTAAIVKMFVYDDRKELISTVTLPRYAGYSEYLWSVPHTSHFAMYYDFRLRAEEYGGKIVSKTAFFSPMVAVFEP